MFFFLSLIHQKHLQLEELLDLELTTYYLHPHHAIILKRSPKRKPTY